MIAAACLLWLSVGAALAQDECSHACCEAGGWCGDAIFDDCDGDWDYGEKCNPTHQTCCLPFEPTVPTSTAPPTEGTTTPRYTGPTTTRPPFNPEACGQRPFPPYGEYIIGGEEAIPNSWPWAVGIELDYFGWGGWEHYCGGVLINTEWIATAAHCIAKSGVSDPNLYRVQLRQHNKQNKESDVLTVGVTKMIYHEDYSTDIAGSPNDVALMKLATPVEYDEKMAPVCLPESPDYDFLDRQCYIVGWGLTKGTGDDNVLREALIDVITNEVCDYKWETGSGRVNLIKDSHICVGNGGPSGPGACNGDSGGPLQCLVETQDGATYWALAGVTSFGASGCVAEDAPDVYTRISDFTDWLQDTMDAN